MVIVHQTAVTNGAIHDLDFRAKGKPATGGVIFGSGFGWAHDVEMLLVTGSSSLKSPAPEQSHFSQPCTVFCPAGSTNLDRRQRELYSWHPLIRALGSRAGMSLVD
jgi:hypothetical protein